jgi:transposase InsO family protein
MDITYIPMARGFVYLAAVVDLVRRKVLAWKLSITLETEFRLEAVEEALARYGPGCSNKPSQLSLGFLRFQKNKFFWQQSLTASDQNS